MIIDHVNSGRGFSSGYWSWKNLPFTLFLILSITRLRSEIAIFNVHNQSLHVFYLHTYQEKGILEQLFVAQMSISIIITGSIDDN